MTKETDYNIIERMDIVVTELAWAAGFYDGEGCTSNGYDRIRCTIGQKERTTLDRFVKAIGFGNVRGPYAVGNRYVVCYNREKARIVLNMLWPYLCEPKRSQAIMKGFIRL